jgi:SAM-dependent methyltransferase
MEDRGRRTEVGLQTTDGDRGQKTEIGEEPGTKNQEPAERFWKPEDYTQYDLCSGEKWPFADKVFDLGLSSHCLEDIRDPVQVVKEMGRVCKRVLIVCPSRLLEQMRGVDHPRYCGMPHHLWMVSEADGVLEFRRKTQIIEFPGMHLSCPPGKIPTTEAGSMYYLSVAPVAREVMYFDTQEDKRDYAAFVAEHADVKCVLEADARWRDWRRWVWYFRQMWFYAV